MTTRSKAFFLNGGAGRMLCSIPALELYEQDSGDTDFVIVCEGGTDMFKGHPTLDARAYDPWHKNLFKDVLKSRGLYSQNPTVNNMDSKLLKMFKKLKQKDVESKDVM